jgi:hypothetical protein
MSTEPRINSDLVLPPIRRSVIDGHSTIEQGLLDAYREGLAFGYEAGVQAEADGEAGANPFFQRRMKRAS